MHSKPVECKEKHLKYLDALREIGATNMFGASPYLEREFGFKSDVAKDILIYWMETFSERHKK